MYFVIYDQCVQKQTTITKCKHNKSIINLNQLKSVNSQYKYIAAAA